MTGLYGEKSEPTLGKYAPMGRMVLLIEDDLVAATRHADWLRESYTVEVELKSNVNTGRDSISREALLRVTADSPAMQPMRTHGDTGEPIGLISSDSYRPSNAFNQFDGHLERPVDPPELRDFVGRLWRRVAYRLLVREEFSVASTLGTKTTRADEIEPLDSDEYRRLLDRKRAIRTQIRTIEREFDPADITALIQREFGHVEVPEAV